MITTEIATAAISIAEEFDRRNLRIVTLQGSGLACLSQACGVQFKTNVNVATTLDERNLSYEPTVETLKFESTMPGAEGAGSVHDKELDSMVTEISDAVSQHLSFAKNTVRPLVQELTTAITAALAAYPDTATFNPVVVRVDLPEPMLMPAIEESIMEYRENAYVPIGGLVVDLKELPACDILAALKTGAKTTDAAIDAWVAKLGENFFSDLWRTVFTKGYTRGTGNVETFETLVEDKVTGTDAAFAVYLLGKRLLDNPPEDSPYSLKDYRMVIGGLLEQAGVRLAKAYERREGDLKSDRLLLNYDSRGFIYVFKPIYEKWLSEGANNAVLLGNVLSDSPAISAPAISERAAEYMTLWERQNRFMTVTLVNRRNVEARKTIAFKTEELLAANLVECFGGYSKEQVITFHTPEVVKAMALVNECVDNLSTEQLADIWAVSTKLVCSCIFYYTDAYKILTGIDSAVKQNPGIDIREAALLSLVEYVTDYVCDQLQVVEL